MLGCRGVWNERSYPVRRNPMVFTNWRYGCLPGVYWQEYKKIFTMIMRFAPEFRKG